MAKFIALFIFIGLMLTIFLTPSLSEGLSRGINVALKIEPVVRYKAWTKDSSKALYSLSGGTDLKKLDNKIGSGRYTKTEFKLPNTGRSYFFSSAKKTESKSKSLFGLKAKKRPKRNKKYVRAPVKKLSRIGRRG